MKNFTLGISFCSGLMFLAQRGLCYVVIFDIGFIFIVLKLRGFETCFMLY